MLIETECVVCGGRLVAGWNGVWYHADRESRHRPRPSEPASAARLDWIGDEEHDFRERTRKLARAGCMRA